MAQVTLRKLVKMYEGTPAVYDLQPPQEPELHLDPIVAAHPR